MPELPEVETIKLGLQKKIIGLKITKIQINSPKSFMGNPNLAQGQKVLNIWRKAKYLGVELGSSLRDHEVAKQSIKKIATVRQEVGPRNDGVVLLFHLKMSGQLVWKGVSVKGEGERFIGGHPTPDMRDEMPNSHTRVIFSFADGSHLYFNDQRRFGWIRVATSTEVTSNKLFEKLGPEPLEKDFTWEVLKNNLLKHKSMSIKVALMDQTVVSGVGNIYSNEACFDAKIDPRTKVGDLEDKEFKAIHEGVIRSIKEGIKHGGSSRAHFVDPEGKKGYFLDYAKVYMKNGRPCPRCKTDIKKIQLGGRGTYLCPKCQVGYNN